MFTGFFRMKTVDPKLKICLKFCRRIQYIFCEKMQIRFSKKVQKKLLTRFSNIADAFSAV